MIGINKACRDSDIFPLLFSRAGICLYLVVVSKPDVELNRVEMDTAHLVDGEVPFPEGERPLALFYDYLKSGYYPF